VPTAAIQVPSELPAPTSPSQADPDVPWGKGGIDDYGWTAWKGDPPAEPDPESAEGVDRA
jgi:hypothetical protein